MGTEERVVDLWICGVVENGIQITPVVVLPFHILHNKKEIHFPFSSESVATKTGLDRGESHKIRPTTKTSLTACSGILISHSPDRCERPPDVRRH